ncbi:MAG: DUF4962 domain-containing protein [Planctomycetes bacterium]|nr:DUF4962 domain-containing protein [Planctomycetota bacterium]
MSQQVTIGPECKVPTDPRQTYARYVRFRPADGQTVTLNPPRFSWPYHPDIVAKEKFSPADTVFTLQISKSKDFGEPAFEVRDTVCNFYNFIPELTGARTWYWRVGYNVGKKGERWSDVRSFAITKNAVAWDRSQFKTLLDSIQGHPRILFNAENRDVILKLRERDPRSDELAKYIIAMAERTLRQNWYRNFPEDDKRPLSYMQMGRSMVFLMFAHMLTGGEKYLGFKKRYLALASWPPGGLSSPEGMGGADKWSTHLTEYLGLFYDWYYDDLTPEERAVVRKSLEWRIDHTMNSFAWRKKGGKLIRKGSIALLCSSHPYENTMVTIPGMLAICDESKLASDMLEIAVHYLIGITNGFGEDECWNEGPGYGNGKMKWLTDATWYLQTAVPQLGLGKNEAYSAYCDFFARITPVGARHCSFGNRGYNPLDWCSSRITNFRRVAMLRGDDHAMQNWLSTARWLKDDAKRTPMSYSPWIDYVLPHYAREPEAKVEESPVKLFPLEGWVTVSSAAPSDYEAQKNAVSMTFHCRPRGGYSHSFRSENGFDIHAYGETIAVGGGTTSNQSYFANHTMSHNTILVNGQGQLAAKGGAAPTYGRVISFRQGKDFVYWAGDATAAYGPKTGLEKFVRHVVFVDDAYFVIFDDLAFAEGTKPGTFQWLYHTTPAVPLDYDAATGTLQYTLGKTKVIVTHIAHVSDLTFRNLPGAEGMTNPITGEGLLKMDKWLKSKVAKRIKKKIPKPLDANHIWISHKTPRQKMNFLAVIVPFRDGEEAPTITRLSNKAVKVVFRGKENTLSFDKEQTGDIVVDISSF